MPGMSIDAYNRNNSVHDYLFFFLLLPCAAECLNRCTIPMLADTRLQTQCTDSQGRPQPLGKCADPAAEFQRIINKEMWATFLEDWMTQGKAHSACRELLVLQEEDASAWQRQVFLMYSHLDSSEPALHHMTSKHPTGSLMP